MSDPDKAHEASEHHIAALRAYAGTESTKHLAVLLDSLRIIYMHEMVFVTRDELEKKQGALQQVMALRAALDSPNASPRI